MASKKQKKDDETGLIAPQPDTLVTGNKFSSFETTPFNMMRRFMDDMDRLFESFIEMRKAPILENELAFPQWSEFERDMWSPQIEVIQNNGEMTVRADLPGLKREDINVEIADRTLTLQGERHEELEDKEEGFYRSERSYGSFYRCIPLPGTVKPEDATATFENGVLEVKIAVPAAELNARRVEILAGEAEAPKAAAAGK